MEPITLSEVAGFTVAGLLVAAALAAPRVDNYIARSQRRLLKLCEQCGGLNRVACKKCKGQGEVAPNLLSFSKEGSCATRSCIECQGRGHFPCLVCSKGKISVLN